MKFSLCLEPVFPEVEIYERVQFAKECGLDAIELWDPSVYDAKSLPVRRKGTTCRSRYAACATAGLFG